MGKENKIYGLPYNPKLKETARQLRKARNLAEVLLWQQLKNKKFRGLDFDRQIVIGNFIVDIYCSEKRTIIEIDGSSHDNKVEQDAERDAFMRGLGLEVIRILDKDVKTNLQGVMQYLEKRFEAL